VNHENKKFKDFGSQNFGDGVLEILGFGGPISLALERSLSGRADRIWQAKAPFVFHFKRSEDTSKPLQTYMQIDGEYYNVIAPKKVTVTKCAEVPRIKVLFNPKKSK
jgi:Diacylglycerol kinase accessory domain.